MVNSGVDRSVIIDYSLRLVNQPEVVLVAFESEVDRGDLFGSLESSEFTFDRLFNLPKADKISKRMLPKHFVFWNTKHRVFERFALQTFKFFDEGKEVTHGTWVGTYGGKNQQVEHSEFFGIVKNCRDLVPVLMVFERFEILFHAGGEEEAGSKKQKVMDLVIRQNSDKFM